jgi:hypothetical protein
MDWPEIAEAFDVDFKADPYGTAANIVSEALKAANDNKGAMNPYEARILREVADVFKTHDSLIDLEGVDFS